MKSITVSLTEDKELQVTASEKLNPTEATDLLLSALLAMYNTVTNEAPKEQQQDVKEYFFNMFNISASALLSQFAPDIDLRPDLTEEAIFIKELELANDKLSDM